MSEVTRGEQQLESLNLTPDLRSSTQRQAPQDPAWSNITAGTVSSAGHPPPTPSSQGPLTAPVLDCTWVGGTS